MDHSGIDLKKTFDNSNICQDSHFKGIKAALSNQKIPCRHICHFCGDKVFAVATI